jgi:RimJ/RimL family protein N-acetyltransferase
MFQLTTERLLLRHFDLQDAEPIYQVFGDPEVIRFSDGPKTKEWVQNWLLWIIFLPKYRWAG